MCQVILCIQYVVLVLIWLSRLFCQTNFLPLNREKYLLVLVVVTVKCIDNLKENLL